MAVVTVSGGDGQAFTLTYAAPDLARLAQTLADAVALAAQSAPVSTVLYDGPPPDGRGVPAAPAGTLGQVVVRTPGNRLALPAGRTVLLVQGGGPNTVQGGGGLDQRVLADDGALTLDTGGGGGTVLAGDGGNRISVPGGSFLVQTGAGDDTVDLGGGRSTVAAGAGRNLVGSTGPATGVVLSAGQDTVAGFSGTGRAGADTVSVLGGGGTLVLGGGSDITFVGGAGPSTVIGAAGGVTVRGGAGGGVFHGGRAGNNRLTGEAGAVTLFGGGAGDVLSAASAGSNVLVAGAGNETLLGGDAMGPSLFVAGFAEPQRGLDAATTVQGGPAGDTIRAGTGTLTADGRGGADLYVFEHGSAGGAATLRFDPLADRVQLRGYADGEADRALAGATRGGNGLTVTLSDNTRITFLDLASLDRSVFG